jgi:DNA-binding ferritin-like protein
MAKDVSSIANLYVATLRGLYLVEQNSHWLTKGLAFYGDHLLFERLYQASAEGADLAAEKMIGLFEEKGLDMKSQAEYLIKLLNKYQGEDLHELCLQMEKDFLSFTQAVYEFFEEEGYLTLGLDDLLMSIASKHEEAVYLLQQALDEKD